MEGSPSWPGLTALASTLPTRGTISSHQLAATIRDAIATGTAPTR